MHVGYVYADGRSLFKKGRILYFHEEWQEGYQGQRGDGIHSPSVYAKKKKYTEENKQTMLVCVLLFMLCWACLSLPPCLHPSLEHTPSFAPSLFLSLLFVDIHPPRWTGTGTCHAMPYQLFLLLLVYMLLYLLARCKIKKRGEKTHLDREKAEVRIGGQSDKGRREGLTCL